LCPWLGYVGGIVSRVFIPEAIVLAQGQPPSAKLVRAERIELVNKEGNALAVLEIGYSNALPAAAAMLTFNDTDELLHQERKLILTTTQLNMHVGDESTILAPGAGFTFHDSSTKTGGGIGNVPPTFRPGIFVYSPDGITTLDTGRLNMADKVGRSRATVP
jgi:hypothetical protein